jgi:hypothetical protein
MDNTTTSSKKDERTTMGESTLVDNTITIGKKDERTNNGIISIGGQHNNHK